MDGNHSGKIIYQNRRKGIMLMRGRIENKRNLIRFRNIIIKVFMILCQILLFGLRIIVGILEVLADAILDVFFFDFLR